MALGAALGGGRLRLTCEIRRAPRFYWTGDRRLLKADEQAPADFDLWPQLLGGSEPRHLLTFYGGVRNEPTVSPPGPFDS